MCDDACCAGLTILTVGELRALNLESADYWTDEKLMEVFGGVPAWTWSGKKKESKPK